MIKGSDMRRADHLIEPLFLDRWSPRAMTGETISQEELMVLFEAARWAPSSYNNQPWRILYARRDSEHWQLFFDLLVEFNQSWAKSAGTRRVTLPDGGSYWVMKRTSMGEVVELGKQP